MDINCSLGGKFLKKNCFQFDGNFEIFYCTIEENFHHNNLFQSFPLVHFIFDHQIKSVTLNILENTAFKNTMNFKAWYIFFFHSYKCLYLGHLDDIFGLKHFEISFISLSHLGNAYEVKREFLMIVLYCMAFSGEISSSHDRIKMSLIWENDWP